LKHYASVGIDALRFYKNLLGEKTNGAYLALACIGFVALFVIIFMVADYQRGASRATMRVFSACAAVLAAFFVACVIGRSPFFDRAVRTLIPAALEKASLGPVLDATLREAVLPFLFMGLFLVFNLIFGLPHMLICGILGFSYKNNNKFTRAFGALIGALHGVLVSVMILLPCFGLVKPYVDIVKNPAPEEKNYVAFYDIYLEETAESPLYRYSMRFGGNRLLRELEEGDLIDRFLK
jgi:hypothetical protein